jgi:hypothetical protein
MDLQQPEVRKQVYKAHLMALTDPAEIASAERDSFDDIIAAKMDSQWWAYAWSVKRWRERQANGATAANSATEG